MSLRGCPLLLPKGYAGFRGREDGYASDAQLGREVLKEVSGPSPLIADAGFNAWEVWGAAKVKGLRAIVRLKKGGKVRDQSRRGAEKGFDRALYRLRMVGEGVFGGIKIRVKGAFPELLEEVAQKSCLRPSAITCAFTFLSF